MGKLHRVPTAIAMMAISLSVLAAPAAMAFDLDGQKCRAALYRTGTKLSRTALKAMTDCHRLRVADDAWAGVDCNDLSQVDLTGTIANAERKFAAVATRACSGQPAALLYEGCPAPCNAGTPSIADFEDVAECMTCLGRENAGNFGEDVPGTPASPLQNLDERNCHLVVTKAATKFFSSVLKVVGRCQAAAEAAGGETIDGCTDTGFSALVQHEYDKTVATVLKGCSGFQLGDGLMDPCGAPDAFPGSFPALAECVAATTREYARQASAHYLRLEGEAPGSTTTTTVVTTTTTLAGDASCPNAAEIVVHSRDSHVACTSNADCTAPRTCDAGLGTCTTTSELDQGWMGLGHDADLDDGTKLRTRLSCLGPAGPTCGECDVAGIDPAPGNCRCANDPRTICDKPFQNDYDDCGGSACECWMDAPTPTAFGGTPMCVLNRFAENLTGTVDVDTGAVDLHSVLRSRVHLGTSVTSPCPPCGGKCSDDASPCSFDSDCGSGSSCIHDTPGDGNRDGVCIGGASDGLSCDASASNASLPARTGGDGGSQYSLDCMPSPGTNVSGAGLRIALDQSTGAVSLASGLDCDGSGPGTESCPCKLCTKDRSVACSGDGDCASQGGFCSLLTNPSASTCSTNGDCASVDLGACVTISSTKRCSDARTVTCTTNADCQDRPAGDCLASTCSSSGFGVPPLPNSCENLSCSDTGGGEGQCTTGPDDRYCDGVVEADGSGVFACQGNGDCLPGVIGIAGGNCGIVERRRCFLPTVAASGQADPEHPVLAAAYCMPPTANAGINTVIGLPGPARQRSQTTLATWCTNAPHPAYTPGVGGCP